MWFRTIDITGMIMGSGWVGFGAIGSGLDPLRGAHPRIRWVATPVDWAVQTTHAVRLAGPRRGFGPNASF
jgi:hypothetical protein